MLWIILIKGKRRGSDEDSYDDSDGNEHTAESVPPLKRREVILIIIIVIVQCGVCGLVDIKSCGNMSYDKACKLGCV